MWRSLPAPTQTTGLESKVRSTKIGRSAGQRERRHTARLEARRSDDLGRSSHAGMSSTRGSGDLRRVRPTIAGDERDHGPGVAHEHERLDDLLERAAGRVRSCLRRRRARFELLQPCLRARRPQVGGNTLDGLGPGHRPILRCRRDQ